MAFFWWVMGAVTGAGAMGWWRERAERRRTQAINARLRAALGPVRDDRQEGLGEG